MLRSQGWGFLIDQSVYKLMCNGKSIHSDTEIWQSNSKNVSVDSTESWLVYS